MDHKIRKQFRYKNYDYSRDGFYFITICTKNMKYFFGDVQNKEMRLSKIGEIAKNFWLEIPKHFDNVKLGTHQIMPNHIHGIVMICRRNEALPRSYTGQHPHMSKISPKPKSISTIIGSFKSIITKTINQKFSNINFTWQPRFHDRIIRNDDELDKISQYIINNPLNWGKDKYKII